MSNENSNSQNSPENKKRSWYWEDKPVSPFVGNASMMPSLMVCNGCPGWGTETHSENQIEIRQETVEYEHLENFDVSEDVRNG